MPGWSLVGGDVSRATTALAGDYVEVAATQRRAPVADQILGARQEVRPGIPGHGGRGFPDHGELAVVLDLANQHRLGDVVVRHHGGVAAGEVGHARPDDGDFHVSHGVADGYLHRFNVHVGTDVLGCGRVVGGSGIVALVDHPGVDEVVVGVVIHAHEVVPGSQVANQRSGG